jgi:hypothetical protein
MNKVCVTTSIKVNAVATPTPTRTPTATATPGGTSIGVNGCKVTYHAGGGTTCTSSGFGFDNCSGSVTLDVGCAITSGALAVTVGDNVGNFTTCGKTVTAGSIPGTVDVPCTGSIAQGTCPPGDVMIVSDGNIKEIGNGTVVFTWSCGPGA